MSVIVICLKGPVTQAMQAPWAVGSVLFQLTSLALRCGCCTVSFRSSLVCSLR